MLEATEVTKKVYVFEPDELELLLEKTREEIRTKYLIGETWTIEDINKRLRGKRRGDITAHIIIPKLDELLSIGALLMYPHSAGGDGNRYLFRATRMAQWLEDNMDQISKGGWHND